jgi:hypothetical protein
MLGKLDKEVIEKFKIFQQKSGKYGDLDIESVRFESESLSSISLITMGQSPKGEYLNKYERGIPFFQGKTDYGEVYLDKPSTWTIKSKKEAKKGDILISLRAPAGAVNIANIDLSIGRGLASVRCNDKVTLFYLYYYLKNNEIRISNDNENGGFFSSMNKDYLYDISVPIPKDLNETYTSYKIQEIIVEFLEYSFKEIETIKERIDKRYDIFKRLKKSLIPSTFIKDYVKVAFGRYAKEKGIDFNITDVEFYAEKVNNIINSKGGSGAYNKNYINNNKGEYPLYTGSKEIVAYVKAINKNDIVDIESVSFNKDNDAGSKAFYHTKPYIVGGHHYSLTIKDEFTDKILIKYFYYCIADIFSRNKFYQSKKPVANIGLIKNFDISIPKDLDDYTSLEIQKIIADFIEYTENRLQKEFDRMDEVYEALNLLYKTYLARTFSLIDWEKEDG